MICMPFLDYVLFAISLCNEMKNSIGGLCIQPRAQYRRRNTNEEQSLQLTDLTSKIRVRCLLIDAEVKDALQE